MLLRVHYRIGGGGAKRTYRTITHDSEQPESGVCCGRAQVGERPAPAARGLRVLRVRRALLARLPRAPRQHARAARSHASSHVRTITIPYDLRALMLLTG